MNLQGVRNTLRSMLTDPFNIEPVFRENFIIPTELLPVLMEIPSVLMKLKPVPLELNAVPMELLFVLME